MVKITINDRLMEVPEGSTILDAAQANNILIPTLCHMKDIHKIGSCRICVVEVAGQRTLMASCVTPVSEGMVVQTNTPRVRKARKVLYELLMSDHPKDCLQCSRNRSCELQELGEVIQATTSRFEGRRSKEFVDASSPSVVRDANKCVLCRRCVTICNEVQGVGAINVQNRGFESEVGPGENQILGTAVCAFCGQCTVVCPVNALHEADGTEAVWKALADPAKTVVVQTAPAVRAALGEEFGFEPGTRVTGKMASALRELGFKHVFDTNFTADLTIMEEGTEFLHRVVALLASKGAVSAKQLEALGLPAHLPEPVLPMITSCSPGWIKYAEHFYPDQLAHLSSCKSPHMMLGALAKTWFAKNAGIDSANMFVVSVMPCTAKKYEITRPEMVNDGMRNVDAVLTTRELARMIKQAGIDFANLPEGKFDDPMGLSTGAADIFGVTGGVMEAALRTVYEIVTGRELPFDGLHVKPIVGLDRVKTASFKLEKVRKEWAFLEGVEVKIAVTNGLAGAAALMDEIRAGSSEYLFIEVMGCPGGCITGGGQPRTKVDDVGVLRMKALYTEDESKKLRKSHTNPDIARLYSDFLGQPCGHASHELLHTVYTPRNRH